MTAVVVGSLCTGYGGLDTAAAAVLGGRVVWHADNDLDVARLLAHHHPGIPNHGDITTVDWTAVEPVDVLTAGYPCQPFSVAGRRAGDDDERHLWPAVHAAITTLRPQTVVLENVAGHLSLGFGAVLADLAAVGYDAAWCVVRAADVGAPHLRARVFVTATPTTGNRPPGRPVAVLDGTKWVEPDHGLFGAVPWTGRVPTAGRVTAGAMHPDPEPTRPSAVGALLPTPRTHDSSACEHGSGGLDLATAVALLPTPVAGDGRSGAQDPRIRRAGGHRVSLADAVTLLPTPTARDWKSHGPSQMDRTAPNLSAVVELLPTPTATPYGRNQSLTCGAAVRPSLEGITEWDRYEPAIRRWESAFTGPAPAPVEVGERGGRRLAAGFAEWMMGIDKGHVTDVPGLTRRARLRILGNGVVPQQAECALRNLAEVQS